MKAGATADAATLQAFAKDRIAERAAAPVAVHLLAEMPLTSAGKIDKPLLREMSARDVIAAMVAGVSGVSRVPQVTAVADPRHGTVYRVALAADADTAGRVSQVLAALACRCEVVAESPLELP